VAAAPGGTPAADWRTLQLSCATFLCLWLANQALWRRLRWHTGKADALCVRAPLLRRSGAGAADALLHSRRCRHVATLGT
jgi:hypothetical protein